MKDTIIKIKGNLTLGLCYYAINIAFYFFVPNDRWYHGYEKSSFVWIYFVITIVLKILIGNMETKEIEGDDSKEDDREETDD